MLKSIGVMGNMNKVELPEICEQIIKWARSKHITPILDPDLYNHLKLKIPDLKAEKGDVRSSSIICLLGGDGFMLHSSHRLYPCKVPVLPVNLGSLGFNTQAEPEEIIEALENIYERGAIISERFLLRVASSSSKSKHEPAIALNEALLIKDTRSRMINVEISVDDHVLGDIPCDGFLVSTPTGSTAYNLSAAGPLVFPSLPTMIATPICPHTIAARSIILPSTSSVKLKLITWKDREDAFMCTDGQIWWELFPGDEVIISRAPDPLLIAEAHPERYFSKLRKQFFWGVSPARNTEDQ